MAKRFASLFTVENAAEDGNGFTNLVQYTPDGETIVADEDGVLSGLAASKLKFRGAFTGTGAAIWGLMNDGGEQLIVFETNNGYPLGAGTVSNLRAWGKNAIDMAVDVEIVKVLDNTSVTFTGVKVTFALHGGGPPVGQHLANLVDEVSFTENEVLGLAIRIPVGSDTGTIHVGASLDFKPAA